MSTSSGSSSSSGGGNDASSAASSLFDQYQNKLNSTSSRAILINLAVMVGLSLGTLTLFALLRPRNKLVYMPRYKYSTEEKRPPRLDDGLFSWIRPLMNVKEPQMVDMIGLDGVVFLRFLRTMRWMCTVIAILSCAVLIPINLIYNSKHGGLGRNFFYQISIIYVKGSVLYAHLAFSYIVCFICYFFMYQFYSKVVQLRWQWFRSADYQNALYARSLMITHVPKKYMSDPGLQTLLDSLNVPYPTTSVHINRRVAELPVLVDLHNKSVEDLEQVLTTYLRSGSMGPKRPTKRLGGFAGIGGHKVDSIDYHTQRIKTLESKIESTRYAIVDAKPENYGFASFSNVASAHIVAKRVADKRVKGVAITLAPPPSSIIWRNLTLSDVVVFRQKLLGGVILFVVAALYTIPTIAVALLANLAALTQYVTFFADWSNKSAFTFSAVQGILPPILSMLLQLLLPSILRKLARFQAATTTSKLDRDVMARYFAFNFITQFIIFSLLGVAFSLVANIVVDAGQHEALSKILEEFKRLPGRIQGTYVQQSSYWLTWFSTRGFSTVLDLAAIISLLWTWMRTKVFGRTPRQIREWTKPQPYDFPCQIANCLLMIVVAMVYAPLAPLVPVLAAVAFFLQSWISKFQLLYSACTEVESGGRFARMIVNRTLFALCVMNVLMCLTIGLQLGWINSIAALPPIALTLAFKLFLKARFDAKFLFFIPNQLEAAEIRDHLADSRKNRLERRFGHPALTAPLYTPMLHKDHVRFLSELYSGRLDTGSEILEDQKVPTGPDANTGGIKFAAIAAHDLLYSTGQYLRERDEDEMSLASTAVLPNAGRRRSGDLQLDAARRAYLERGPGSFAPSATEVDESIEMSRVPSRVPPYGSQENLLRRHQDPSYADIGYAYPPSGSTTGPNMSYDGSRANPGPYGHHSRSSSQQTFSSPPEHYHPAFAPQVPSPRRGDDSYGNHAWRQHQQ